LLTWPVGAGIHKKVSLQLAPALKNNQKCHLLVKDVTPNESQAKKLHLGHLLTFSQP